MRILVFSLYNGQVNRGAESWTYQFFKTLKNKGVDIILVQGGEKTSELVQNLDGIIVEKTVAKDLSGDKSLIGKIKKRLKIHSSQILVKKFSKKCLKYLDLYNPDWIMPSNGCVPLFKKEIQKKGRSTKICFVGHAGPTSDLKYADVFFGLSTRDKETAHQKYPHLKSFHIPNGIDLGIFNPGKLKNDPITSSFIDWPRPRILCVSALTEYKRMLSAVKAFKYLKDGSMLILGDGPERDTITEYIKNSLSLDQQSKIQILSHIDFKRIPAFYDWADIFVHPAKESEAFGSVIIEAMAMGKPLVLNDDLVRKEIAGEIGFYVDPENANALAAQIQHAFDHLQDKHFSQKIINYARRYDWEKIGEEYKEILQNELLKL